MDTSSQEQELKIQNKNEIQLNQVFLLCLTAVDSPLDYPSANFLVGGRFGV